MDPGLLKRMPSKSGIGDWMTNFPNFLKLLSTVEWAISTILDTEKALSSKRSKEKEMISFRNSGSLNISTARIPK